MKSDLDRLMREANIDALLVTGPAAHNPPMMYFTARRHLTQADLIKRVGAPPVLYHWPMERDEAADTGFEIRDLSAFDQTELLKEAGDDVVKAVALRYQRILTELEVRGRVALYGTVDLGQAFAVFRQVQAGVPDLELVGEHERQSVITRARATKDDDEVARIRQMGKITTAVVADVADFLCSHQAKDGILVNRAGEALTIGEVKRRIDLWLAMRGAENPEGTVFAIGRDAGVPHSTGNDQAPVEVGKPIVFDLFPCEAGGGYFYDITRTWCMGYAPDEVVAIYEDVLEVYNVMEASLTANTPCREHQVKACELFEAKGHPTILNQPRTEQGYVHALSHGVGLAVHEGPYFTSHAINRDMLLPRSVVTIEPGLYYPDRGIGVRLENTVWIPPEGRAEVLAPYPMDLVLKVPGA